MTFYLQRTHGMWGGFVWVLILGHFVVPFLFLLPRAPKFRSARDGVAGGWLVLMHLVDVYWIVIPAHVRGWRIHGRSRALAAVGGVTVAVGAWRQRGVALIPVRDPFFATGVAYRSPL